MSTITARSPGGNDVTLAHREDTSDLSTIGSTFGLWDNPPEDEYRLRDLALTPGDVFVDIGAHIGAVSMAVLADFPGVRVIAVEPLAENCAVLTENGAAFGDRLTILQAAIARGRSVDIGYDFAGDETLRNHRYIGGMASGQPSARQRVTVPTVSLASLVKMAGGRIAAMKIDCEGCEWQALRSPAIRNVGTIIGEWHGHGLAEVRSLLHGFTVEPISDHGGTGTFRAVRR